jgi:parallel beta-helix repeat protein
MTRHSFPIIAAVLAAFLGSSSRATVISIALQPGDDHASSNSAALRAALDRAAPGDTINLPAGTFPISSSISLRSRITLAGAGSVSTTLTAAFSREQAMIVGGGLANVDLYGFTLFGAGDADVTEGIQLEKSTAMNLHDLAIVSLPGSDDPGAPLGPHAIDCTSDVTHSSFTAITARSIGIGRTWGGGIRLSWNSSGNKITHCTIDQTGRGGIFCNDGATDNVIADNTVTGSGGVGLGIEVQNCDRSLIERNKIDHWLSVDNCSLSAIRGNTIAATDKTYKLCGIEIVDCHDVIVSDNTVNGGAKVGLSLSGPHPKTRMLFSGNLFTNANTWGAQIQGDAGGASDLYFEHNGFVATQQGPDPLYPNQGHGLRINGNAHHLTFERNEITNNTGSGLQITGDDVDDLSFYKNLISNNRGGSVDSDPIKHLAWIGNQVFPIPRHWIQDAQQAAEPRLVVNIANATAAAPGADRVITTTGSPLHFTLSTGAAYVPRDVLWDFGSGLPRTGLTAEEKFDKPGSHVITVITWDSAGGAALVDATIDVRKPNARVR